MDNRSFTWRIGVSVVLTSLGVLYYLVFLFYLCGGGVPIEKIHYFMTDGWPNFCADNVPFVAPVFLFIGLGLWYSYTLKNKPKSAPEPEYQFEFTKFEKTPAIVPDPDYVFENGANKKHPAPTQQPNPTNPTE